MAKKYAVCNKGWRGTKRRADEENHGLGIPVEKTGMEKYQFMLSHNASNI